MSPFTVLVLCIQAFLIQSVMSNCGFNSGYRSFQYAPSVEYSAPSVEYIAPSYSSAPSVSASTSSRCGYGGQGTGTVRASGDIGACGTTQVVGTVPVIGEVSFGGKLNACGSTIISGQCGCGCNKSN